MDDSCGDGLARSEALVVLPKRSQTTCGPWARFARAAKSASFDQMTEPGRPGSGFDFVIGSRAETDLMDVVRRIAPCAEPAG